ncbi:hypothetical protein [Streptomyces sp. NPDC053079]|uniref:hypothetical protein n=1 Tax=Streptomyces sp. NPDC053079 TaxID=3365697 RepID=UPI0037D2D70F
MAEEFDGLAQMGSLREQEADQLAREFSHCWPHRLFVPFVESRDPGEGYRWRVARADNTTRRVCTPEQVTPDVYMPGAPKQGDQQEHPGLRAATL